MRKHIFHIKNRLDTLNPYKDCGKLIRLGSSEVFVAENGMGENMILINGIAASSYTWRKVFYGLSEVFRVAAMDFTGTGFSDKPEGRYSLNVYCTQLLRLMDYLHMEKAILVGNSLGGEVALDFAIKYPERVFALVLIDSAGYQQNKEVTAAMVKTARSKLTTKILKALTTRVTAKWTIKWALHNHSVINKEMVEGYYRPMKENGSIEAFVSLIKSLSYTDFDFSKIYTIQKPTLIIWGSEDKWIPVSDAYKFQKAINKSRLEILEGCGHGPQEEEPEQVIRIIKDFFNNK